MTKVIKRGVWWGRSKGVIILNQYLVKVQFLLIRIFSFLLETKLKVLNHLETQTEFVKIGLLKGKPLY